MTHFTPGIFAAYRGKDNKSSALQMRLVAATALAAGYVLLDMTDGPTAFKFDWSKKLTWKFNLTELAAISLLGTQPLAFSHDPQAKRDGAGLITKKLTIKPAPNGGAFIDLVEYKQPVAGASADPPKKHSIALNDEELFVMQSLCRAAIPLVLGWTAALCATGRSTNGAVASAPAQPVAALV